jgi:hypothetical protein
LGFKIKVRLKPKGKIEEKPPRMAYIHFLEISRVKGMYERAESMP